MPAAPSNPATARTATRMTRLVTLASDQFGSTPTAADEVPYLKPTVIARSSGGQRLDHVEFAYDLGLTGERVRSMRTPTNWIREVQIRVADATGATDGHCLFWGDVVEQRLRLDSTTEEVAVVARVEPCLFGEILDHYVAWNPKTGLDVDVQDDPVFNPEVDGETIPNQSDHHDLGSLQFKIWIDPESARTDAAADFQFVTRSEWSLKEALNTLLWMLNADEEFISNPDVLNDAIFDDAPAPKNLTLRRGRYLPEYLDALLHPAGFDWYVKCEMTGPDEVRRTIAFWKRGSGPEKELFWQDIGETRDPAKHNLDRFELTLNVADLANRIVAHGSLQEREVTVPLYRGWQEADDGLRPDQLDNTAVSVDEDGMPTSAATDSQFDAKRNVWRLFVANEAGDHTALRTTGTPTGMGAPPDFSTIFDGYVPRRLKLEHCLTKETHEDTVKRREPLVEWSADAGVNWQPVPHEWGLSILSDQIGVRFDGKTPPEDLMDAADQARLRITGTIAGDARLTCDVENLVDSPSGRPVTLFLDLSDRFHDREVVRDGDFASCFQDDTRYPLKDEADDAADMEEYVRKYLEAEQSASQAASIDLFGLHFDYEIGDLLTKVSGREISLDANSESAANPRYLQITGIAWNEAQQTTALTVEPAAAPAID